jgi:Fe-S oxidoreductase
MENLKDYEKDINKCSKCGLCQAVCPIYKITGNDCAVSRGKFVMLEGILKGELKPSKRIIKYLDMCNKCGKCKDFCPSDIDVLKIFETAKFEYTKKSLYHKFLFFLESRFVFSNFLNLFDWINKIFYRHKSKDNSTVTMNLLYFKGCANKISPINEIALKQILKSYNNVNLVEKDFDCCGVPFLSSGNLKRYEEAKSKNLKLMQGKFDYVITDCASCEDSLNQYNGDIPIINVIDFIMKNPKKFIFNKPLTVTFHKPCHLKNTDFLKQLIKKCQNVEYIEMEDFDECCGFSGEFTLNNPKLALQMMKTKAKNAIKTNADIVLTLCPACIIGLKLGLFGQKNAPKVMNLVEFLSHADKIS